MPEKVKVGKCLDGPERAESAWMGKGGKCLEGKGLKVPGWAGRKMPGN